MRLGWTWAVVLAAALLARTSAHADEEAGKLTPADRAAFVWFDSTGVPSCADKRYVRVTWVRKSPPSDASPADRLWEIDGFVVKEDAEQWTILDADQIGRRVVRAHPQWTISVAPLDLTEIADAASARLKAMRTDPGAVEPIEQIFRGVKHLLGEEAVALAFARHCAENHLDAQAHEVLDAARGMQQSPAAKGPRPLETIAAEQMAEPLMRRMYFDLTAPEIPRDDLLNRFQKWRQAFATNPDVQRADEAIRVLAPMVIEDAAHKRPSDAELAALTPDARAQELVFQLRDQTGDVFVTRFGAVSLDFQRSGSLSRLVAMKLDAVPALLDALTDERFTRSVLFVQDEDMKRQFVARVGDAAQEALRQISRKQFREITLGAPSMFQDGSAPTTATAWRAWWAGAADVTSALQTLAAEQDPTRRAALARAFPDCGISRLGGAANAVWGTRSWTNALPTLDEATANAVLRTLIADAGHPRTKALAAWALLDGGDGECVASIAALWRTMDAAQRSDRVQGGAVIAFLAACGDLRGIAALTDGLDTAPPAARELVVQAFAEKGAGATRGFAADAPDGINTLWPRADAATADLLRAAQDLIAARLGDVEEDPLGLIPRQIPLCDMVPEFDCGRRIADLAIRVLNARWPAEFAMESAPVRKRDEWEAIRVRFLDAWKRARAERSPR